MILRFDPTSSATPGAPRTMVVRAGEWTIAIVRLEHSAARWVIVEAYGYLSGDEGLAFATLLHARCWFICRLGQTGRTLLRSRRGSKRPTTRRAIEVRPLH